MVKIKYENYGAQMILTLTGETDAVAQTVNNYANFGMFTDAAIPTEYDPAKHSRVTIAATRARVLPALEAIAMFQLANAPEFKAHRVANKGAKHGLLGTAKTAALAAFACFEQVKLSVVADETEKKGDLRDYTLRDDEITPYMRKQGRQILANVFGARRESAKGAGRSSAE